LNFLLDLSLSTEDVGIVLHETTDSGQTSESTGGLVTVQNTEVGNAHGQLAVAAVTVTEEQAVAGAVHGLECPLLLLDLECEHVLVVVLPVT
jgi:hypothetical protein